MDFIFGDDLILRPLQLHHLSEFLSLSGFPCGRIDAPTPYVWIIGRTKTDGPADYDAAHKIQAGYKITPLSRWGKPAEPITGKIDPAVDMKTPPKVQVDTMPAGKFFAYAAEVLKLQPPHLTDQLIVALPTRTPRTACACRPRTAGRRPRAESQR